jgi:hypothetical protein
MIQTLFLRSSEKDLAPPPEECLQLISRATQVFREQYILKQDLAKEEIQRRYDGLRLPTISLWVVAGAAQQPGPGFCLNVTFSP